MSETDRRGRVDDDQRPVKNCNALRYADNKMYRRGGKDFMIKKGNPKNL